MLAGAGDFCDGKMLLEVRKRTRSGRMASMRAIASRIVDKATSARLA